MTGITIKLKIYILQKTHITHVQTHPQLLLEAQINEKNDSK